MFAAGAVLGLLVVVAGVLVLAADRPPAFGWTAYAPLPRIVYLPPSHEPLALALLMLGSALMGAGLTGAVLSRRR